jgi:hypothetical protein
MEVQAEEARTSIHSIYPCPKRNNGYWHQNSSLYFIKKKLFPWGRVLLENLTVAEIIGKFDLLRNQKVYCFVHNSLVIADHSEAGEFGPLISTLDTY